MRAGARVNWFHSTAFGRAFRDGDAAVAQNLRGKKTQGALRESGVMAFFFMDEDLEHFTRDQLLQEIRKLRAGIREHRDSSKHELCWHHPQLWGLLPEKIDPEIAVPAWPQFLRGCLHYRESLDRQQPNARRITEEYQSR